LIFEDFKSEMFTKLDELQKRLEQKCRDHDNIRATLLANFNEERCMKYGLPPLKDDPEVNTFNLFFKVLEHLAVYAKEYVEAEKRRLIALEMNRL
jgi:hypothetical protein